MEEGTGTGLGKFSPRSGAPQVSHATRFDRGEWQVQLVRALRPADTTATPLAPGQAIPIAFFAADGSNGEDEVRGAVSAWYAVYLEVPTPTRVYVQPIVAGLLTAGLGIVLVIRAQRREPRVGGSNSEA